MTPALPALDALLKEVEALDGVATPQPWEGSIDLGCVGYTHPLGGKFTVLAPPNPYSVVGKCDALLAARYRNAAPRLAAIVRVAVEALNSLDDPWGDAHPRNVASAALSRIEALAKGEGS